MVGKRFGKWTILERLPKDGEIYDKCQCKCDCGVISIVRLGAMKRGRSKSCKSCGYLNRVPLEQMIGNIFGNWKVLELSSLKNKNNLGLLFICECKCGKIQHVRADALRTGKTKSCKICQAKAVALSRCCRFCKCKNHVEIDLELSECELLGFCPQCDKFDKKEFLLSAKPRGELYA